MADEYEGVIGWQTGYSGEHRAAILIVDLGGGRTVKLAMPRETAAEMGDALTKLGALQGAGKPTN